MMKSSLILKVESGSVGVESDSGCSSFSVSDDSISKGVGSVGLSQALVVHHPQSLMIPSPKAYALLGLSQDPLV